MIGPVAIRDEQPRDSAGVRGVNLQAFNGPDEAAIVERLRADGLVIVSLVAGVQDVIVGHVLFSRLPVRTSHGDRAAVALAPMAVARAAQRRGIGSALATTGIDRCRSLGERVVVVVGHPEYYPRFGFSAEAGARLRGPFSGPSFMALELVPGSMDEFDGGEVRYPAAFGL